MSTLGDPGGRKRGRRSRRIDTPSHKRTTTVKLDEAEHRILNAAADAEGVSAATIIAALLRAMRTTPTGGVADKRIHNIIRQLTEPQ